MALFNNWLFPESIKSKPPHGGNELAYFVKTFQNLDRAVLDTEVNDFLASLAVDGLGWPHLISAEQNIYTHDLQPNVIPMYVTMITYMTVGAP
jgi:hypothetical protein